MLPVRGVYLNLATFRALAHGFLSTRSPADGTMVPVDEHIEPRPCR